MFPPVQVLAAVGAIGRMMIRAGVLLLLFVAYQLWGTGLHTDRAQSSLENEFKIQQEAIGSASLPGDSATTDVTLPPGQADQSTSTTAPQTASTDIPVPAEGDPVGFISIPDIGSEFYIVEGTALRWLEEGPGHFEGTPLPGQPGNSAIAGHRTTYKAPFNRVDELQPGAHITVTTLQGEFTYEVLPQPVADGEPPVGHYIVGPGAVEILDDKGDNRLTLMACHPKYSAAQRIIVEAELITPPAPPTPRPDVTATATLPGDLVGGNDSARLWAAVFSMLAVALWFGAWFVGHRYKTWRWPAYAIAFPFFAVSLFFAFDFINQLLPGAY